MSSDVFTILPGLLTLLAIAVVGINQGKSKALGLAVLGCLLVWGAPWGLIWYTQTILGDLTANFGALFLILAQPVLIPFAALVGWAIGCNLSNEERQSAATKSDEKRAPDDSGARFR